MLLNLKAISKIELIWDGYNHNLFVLRRISWPTSQFRPLVPQYLCYSVEMCQYALPPLQQTPSAYIRGPQYFQSIQMHEGEQSLRHAIEAIGEDTLMFATDFPHAECWFPKSVDAVLAWTSIPDAVKRKLFWDNAVRCYRRAFSPHPVGAEEP